MVKAIDRSHQLGIVGFTHPLTAELLTLPEEVLAASMHVVAPDGSVASGAVAPVALLCALPRPWRWIGAAARRLRPLGWAVGRLYLSVAARRGRLARLVPDCEPVTVIPRP